MLLREVPDEPWKTFAFDIFYYKGNEYLLAVDYYIKYVKIGLLENSTSKTVIDNLKAIFARNGIPKIVYSDNDHNLLVKKLKNLQFSWNFQHKTSSPTYPQSNGLVERHSNCKKYVQKPRM